MPSRVSTTVSSFILLRLKVFTMESLVGASCRQKHSPSALPPGVQQPIGDNSSGVTPSMLLLQCVWLFASADGVRRQPVIHNHPRVGLSPDCPTPAEHAWQLMTSHTSPADEGFAPLPSLFLNSLLLLQTPPPSIFLLLLSPLVLLLMPWQSSLVQSPVVGRRAPLTLLSFSADSLQLHELCTCWGQHVQSQSYEDFLECPRYLGLRDSC